MIGEIVTHYRILDQLGEGGMGTVYLAEDTRLGRRVAIKFPAITSDEHHYRARFLREARSVSNLSHPHIAAIYDYGETADGHPFLVMELVNGPSLTELLHKSTLTIVRAVEIVADIAEALSEAHQQGIVHRDIKPSNVMLDHRNQVKVLDFGLAKQINEEPVQSADPDADTMLATHTRSGTVVGTPLYLSPEQATCAPVDARSDLFALGALLYECIAGRPAFSGSGALEIAGQVIHINPPLPSSINARVPPELDRITMKALAKRPEDRYQSAEEMAKALREWRASRNGDDGSFTQRASLAFRTSHSSAFSSISDSLRRPRLSIAFLLITVAAMGLILWGILRWFPPKSPVPFQTMRVTRLTNAGKSIDAVISPDGKYVAHVMDEGGQQSLWIKHIPTSGNVQIVPPSEGQYWGLTFSRDGNYIYYVVWEKNSPGTLYRVPVLGGTSSRLLANVDSAISFSPDAKQFAFIRRNPSLGETELMTANADGSAEQVLALRKAPDFFPLVGPAWSPDGKTIACAAGNSNGGFHGNVVEVRVAGGTEKPVTPLRWFKVDRVAWLENGNGLVITALDQPLSSLQMWYVPYPDGEVRRITNDLNSYIGASLTADSRTLVTVQFNQLSNIWVAPGGDTSHAVQATSGSSNQYGLSWTPDGRVVYSSGASGNPDVWIMNADGTEQKQLTVDPHIDRDPSVSSDGRSIVFTSNRTGSFNIWRMDIDGGNARRLTSGSDEQFPQFSPDGRWVVYQGFTEGVPTVWKIPVDGGESLRLTDKYSNWPVVSPDGKWIACGYRNELNSPWKIAVIPVEGGEPVKLFEIPMLTTPTHFWQRVRWRADGRALTYIDNRGGVSNIWSLPVDGGQAEQLTDFKSDRILNFDWSRDGRQLACIRGVLASDVILINDLK
jgi:serine/threonine protein kinase